jgi:hypothetical protein
LTARMKTMLGGFASLYPLYRPAPGVSEGEHAVRPYTLVSPIGALQRGLPKARAVTVQQNAAEGLGVSPSFLFLFPHEWGIKGG